MVKVAATVPLVDSSVVKKLISRVTVPIQPELVWLVGCERGYLPAFYIIDYRRCGRPELSPTLRQVEVGHGAHAVVACTAFRDEYLASAGIYEMIAVGGLLVNHEKLQPLTVGVEIAEVDCVAMAHACAV